VTWFPEVKPRKPRFGVSWEVETKGEGAQVGSYATWRPKFEWRRFSSRRQAVFRGGGGFFEAREARVTSS